MSEYLFRISLTFDYRYTIGRTLTKSEKSPVYVVAKDKKDAEKYAKQFLREGCNIKSIVLLAERLGMNMYHGKPKK